ERERGSDTCRDLETPRKNMRYTVEWLPTAEDDLARLWLNASDRDIIVATADAIDAVLARDPYSQSESRPDRARIMFMLPLWVLFDVDETRQMVSVWAVWRPRRRS